MRRLISFRIFILILILLIGSCSRHIDNERMLPKMPHINFDAVIFCESVDTCDSDNPKYYDIAICNLKTKEKFYVTRDNYLDETPSITNDGKHIVFTSAREGDDLLRSIQGGAAPQKFHVYNVDSGNIIKRIDQLKDLMYFNYYTICQNDSSIFLDYKRHDRLIQYNLFADREEYTYPYPAQVAAQSVALDIDRKCIYLSFVDTSTGKYYYKSYNYVSRVMSKIQITYPKPVPSLLCGASSKKIIYFVDTTHNQRNDSILYKFVAYNYENHSYSTFSNTYIAPDEIIPLCYYPDSVMYFPHKDPNHYGYWNQLIEYNFKTKEERVIIDGNKSLCSFKFFFPQANKK